MKCVLKDCLNAQLGHNCFDAKHSLECCTKSSDMKCVVKDCLSAQLGHNCFNAKHSLECCTKSSVSHMKCVLKD